MISAGDLVLIRTAARRGYDAPLEKRKQCVANVQAVLNTSGVSDRLRTSATKTLEALHRAGWIPKSDDGCPSPSPEHNSSPQLANTGSHRP